MRSPSLTCKMPFAAFPSPHHPITFNFCTLEGKKVRYENKIQPALRVDFIATANSSCVVTVRDSRCNPLTNYPQLFRYASQTAIRCFSAVDIFSRQTELRLLLVLFRAVAVVAHVVHTSHRMDIYIS